MPDAIFGLQVKRPSGFFTGAIDGNLRHVRSDRAHEQVTLDRKLSRKLSSVVGSMIDRSSK